MWNLTTLHRTCRWKSILHLMLESEKGKFRQLIAFWRTEKRRRDQINCETAMQVLSSSPFSAQNHFEGWCTIDIDVLLWFSWDKSLSKLFLHRKQGGIEIGCKMMKNSKQVDVELNWGKSFIGEMRSIHVPRDLCGSMAICDLDESKKLWFYLFTWILNWKRTMKAPTL